MVYQRYRHHIMLQRKEFDVKRLYLIGIMLLVVIAPAHAADWIIDDSFIGGGYYTDNYPQSKVNKYYQKDGDVISEKKHINRFDVDEMSVNIEKNRHRTSLRSAIQTTDSTRCGCTPNKSAASAAPMIKHVFDFTSRRRRSSSK